MNDHEIQNLQIFKNGLLWPTLYNVHYIISLYVKL